MLGVTVTLPLVPPLDAIIMLTLTDCVLDPDVRVIVPLQVWPAPSPLWFTETEKLVPVVVAVKVPVGEIVSQVGLLVQLCSDTPVEKLVELAAVTVRFCDAGALPPYVALNVIPDVLSVNGPVLIPPFTTNTTGYVSGLLGYNAVTVTVPRYAPVARPAGLAVSVMVFAVEVAVSQLVVVVTPIAGVDCPEVPGKLWLLSLKTTCTGTGLAPPL